jgi:alpha-L-rhamnosidase
MSDLCCEYAVNPLGLDTPQPRFSWVLESDARGDAQSAYQILVASSAARLAAGEGDVWDSGRVASSDSVAVEYVGPALASRRRYHWTARAWDAAGRPCAYGPPAWFEMGLLAPEDWAAEWIGYPASLGGRALYLRSTFELARPVARARAYVAGLGCYELRLNGRKVGDHVLDPACSDYSRRVYYATYDVAEYLRPGANAVGAVLGHGWYSGRKLLLQMEIDLEDGSSVCASTGTMNAWFVSTGPLLADSLYDGEEYDARLERPNWDVADGETAPPADRLLAWRGAAVVEAPGGRLVSQAFEPIRVIDTLRPRTITEPRPGVFVFDMGQNLAGWALLTVRGERGTRVTLRFAETLYDDGTVNQENLRAAAATDVYVLKGEGVETWEPRFTYHGFRYVQVEGLPGRPDCDSVRARVVRSAVEPAGEFGCSSELINRIQKMTWWTEASNLHGLPTDCPQRDERMGWLNDMTVRAEAAVHHFNLARLYPKWVADIHDAQCPRTGAITDTAPFRWGKRPADPVDASYLIVPWLLYQHYGDRRTMAEHYDGLKAWVDCLTTHAEGGLVRYSYWGDWAPPVGEAVSSSIGAGAVSRDTPGTLMSTGHYLLSTRLLSEIACVLGRKADAAAYADLARRIAAAYDAAFWDEKAGGYGSNNQACNALSLALGLVPEMRTARVVESLVRNVLETHGGHLATGNLCTKHLLEQLAEHGRADVAWSVVTQETYPSWAYMLAKGATTLWERWEKATGGGMNSHNHPMLGSVSSWFFKYLAGIAVDPLGPAWTRFRVRPHAVEGLTWASAKLRTVRGPVEAAWQRDGDRIVLRVTVPVGSTAVVSVPKPTPEGTCRITEGGRAHWPQGARQVGTDDIRDASDDGPWVRFTVGAGRYEFVAKGE